MSVDEAAARREIEQAIADLRSIVVDNVPSLASESSTVLSGGGPVSTAEDWGTTGRHGRLPTHEEQERQIRQRLATTGEHAVPQTRIEPLIDGRSASELYAELRREWEESERRLGELELTSKRRRETLASVTFNLEGSAPSPVPEIDVERSALTVPKAAFEPLADAPAALVEPLAVAVAVAEPDVETWPDPATALSAGGELSESAAEVAVDSVSVEEAERLPGRRTGFVPVIAPQAERRSWEIAPHVLVKAAGIAIVVGLSLTLVGLAGTLVFWLLDM